MSACVPIRFGVENHVVGATLTSTPAPVTELNWLKNEWRARQVRWVNPAGDIIIEGVLPKAQIAEYFALPNSNLTGLAKVKLELFDDLVTPVDVLNMEFTQLAELIPLGEWRSGIDPYGVPRDIDNPDVFVLWLDTPTLYRSFKLTIKPSDYEGAPSDINLRMLLIGNKLQLEKNFSYGNEIQFLSEPELVQTSSGSFLPSRKQRKSRRWSLSLDQMTDNDRAFLWRMESTLEGRPFLVSAYPGEHTWQFNNYSFLARFSTSLSFSHTYRDIHAVNSLILVEV